MQCTPSFISTRRSGVNNSRIVSKFSRLCALSSTRIPGSSMVRRDLSGCKLRNYVNSLNVKNHPLKCQKPKIIEFFQKQIKISSVCHRAPITTGGHMLFHRSTISLGMTIKKRNFHRILCLITVLHSCIITLKNYSITGPTSNQGVPFQNLIRVGVNSWVDLPINIT